MQRCLEEGEGSWGTIRPLLAQGGGGDKDPFNLLPWALHQLL